MKLKLKWQVYRSLMVAALLLGLAGVTAQAQRWQYESKSFTNLTWPTAYYGTYSYTNNGTNWFYVSPTNQGGAAIGAVGIFVSNLWSSTYYTPNSNAQVLYVGDKWLQGVPVDLQLGIYSPAVTGETNGYFTNFLTVSPDNQYWYPSNYWLFGGQVNAGVTQAFDFYLPSMTNVEYVAWDGLWTSHTNPVYIVWWRYHVLGNRY